MKKEKKQEIFRGSSCDFNRAKDSLYDVVRKLEFEGLMRDADQLMNMIYRIEAFQNKYN